MKKHIVLVGDSVFDNGRYVGQDEPDVFQQLVASLPKNSMATTVARDGAVTRDIPGQMTSIPRDATHLVLSVGGNDALARMGVLAETRQSVSSALFRLGHIAEVFADDYRMAINSVAARKLPFAVATIYGSNYDDPNLRYVSTVGTALFNDVITKEAIRLKAPIMDLRTMFSNPLDYANAIEPSVVGGTKMVRWIKGFSDQP